MIGAHAAVTYVASAAHVFPDDQARDALVGDALVDFYLDPHVVQPNQLSLKIIRELCSVTSQCRTGSDMILLFLDEITPPARLELTTYRLTTGCSTN